MRRVKNFVEHVGHRLKRCTGYRLSKEAKWGVDWIDDALRIARQGWLPNLHTINTVFDVGANTGQTAKTLLRRMPITRLCCFEPVPTTFETLNRNLQRHRIAEGFPFGLSDTDGSAKIRVFSSSLLASTCDSTPILSADSRLFDHTETIQLRKLDSVCRELQVDSIDLLKVDTEGADLRMLRGADRMLRQRRISLIVFEFYCASSSETVNGTLHPVDEYLVERGYRLVSFYTDFVNREQPVGVYNALYTIARSGTHGAFRSSAA